LKKFICNKVGEPIVDRVPIMDTPPFMDTETMQEDKISLV